MSSLCLRVRGPETSISLIASPSLSWKDFLEMLAKALFLEAPFDVLYGYPLTCGEHPNERPIGEFLTSNEAIRVQMKSSAGQQAQGVAKKAKPAKKSTTSLVEEKPAVGFGAKIVGLHTSKVTKSSLAGNAQKRTLAAQKDPPAKRRRKSSSGKISSENDIADHLISAVSGGSGTHNRTARKVFRNAVLHQYNSSQAVCRVNAIYSGKFNIRECGGVLLSSTNSSSSSHGSVFTHIEVSYQKGSGSRGNFVDTVELLPKDILLGVLKVAVLGDNDDGHTTDEGKEVLKPMNLSRCSPRIFWSIVHHYGPNLVDNIRNVLQGVDDCSWLEERKKQLSEKALINQQQKNEQEALRSSKRNKKADVVNTETAKVELPSQASQPTNRYASKDPAVLELVRLLQSEVALDEIVPTDWYDAVLSLVGAKVDHSFAVFELARLECSPLTRNTLQSLRVPTSTLSLDQLESWIVSAQMLLFHAVWRQVCGGGSERLRTVLHLLRVRVPKDFRMWRNAPEGLLQGIFDLDPELKGDNVTFRWPEGGGESGPALSVERVAGMCRIAQAAQSLFSWIDDEQLNGNSSDSSNNTEHVQNKHDINRDEEEDEEEGWQFAPTAHVHIGKKARVLVENDYWEDGTIVGYLPPEPEEPMALWRVRLDASHGAAAVVETKNEDLEEHEVEEAIARFVGV